MRIAIILGYRLKDDGTMTTRLMKRCDLAIKYDQEHGFDKLILSGGIANENTVVSEAQRMYEYLVDKGYDKEKLILEEKSMTTWGNMEYSMQLAKPYNPTEIIIITTCDHYFLRYNTVKICTEAINDDNINLIMYLDTVEKEEDYDL